jgi:ABC-type amino acid transport system permease subunit
LTRYRIGFLDLLGVGRTIAGQTYRVFETWIFIAIVYLIWITIFTKMADMVYERKKIPRIEISPN